MSNKKWIITGAVIVAAAVGYVALRSPGTSKKGTEGAIGVANRYQSQQIGNQDVTLDSPQVASFIQSDTFRKLASDAKFREAARQEAFSKVVASDNLRELSAKVDLGKVLDQAVVKDLLRSDQFRDAAKSGLLSEAVRKSPDLFTATEGSRISELLKSPGLADLAKNEDFLRLADQYSRKLDAARAEGAKSTDEARRRDAARAEGAKSTDQARIDQARAEGAKSTDQARMDQARAEAAKSTDQARIDQARAEAARSTDQARIDQARAEAAKSADQARMDQARAEAAKSTDQARMDQARAEAAKSTDQARMDQARAEAAKSTDQARMDQARVSDQFALSEFKTLLRDNASLSSTDAIKALEGNRYFADALARGFMELFTRRDLAAFAIDGLRPLVENRSFRDALRIDGFAQFMEGLTAQNLDAARDISNSPEMLKVLSDASYRDAAMHAELSAAATIGLDNAVKKASE